MTAEFRSPLGTAVPTVSARRVSSYRRLFFLLLIIATIASLTAWLISITAANGFGVLEFVIVAAFLVYSPWLAIGFWNSVIGLFVLHGSDGFAGAIFSDDYWKRDNLPILSRVAIAMTIRNEDPRRSFAHLNEIMESVDRTSDAAQFDYFILSDSSDPAVIEAEETAVAAWPRDAAGKIRLHYRRRAENIGFKGGNVHDFCEHEGRNYEFMVLLDTDSLMSGEFVVRLVRIMQSHPRLGILQSLAVGLPTLSFFARVFQFGHRHGMHCFAAGAGWWQGDRCQFWGHNAVIRVAPFREHCRLPVLSGGPPFGGHIICHDQIEAALMYRAGYEVRLLPKEDGSYEGNPPTLPDFVQRNNRWCQGNLQNMKLIDLPGFTAMSWFHLAFMAQKFFGSAALVILVTAAAFAAVLAPADANFPTASALAFYLVCLGMYFSPKLASIAEAMIWSRDAYGGAASLIIGAIVEIIFTILFVPVTMYAAAWFIIVLLCGRTISWGGQQRDSHLVSWRDALAYFWHPTASGLGLLLLLWLWAPAAILWFLPFIAGLILVIPFSVITSSHKLGEYAARWKICVTPEEVQMPREIRAILGVLK
ncbi:MAG TPA: glucans biosynthesis glucosyltransferase MdoH [Xanthobacteraceae bacterium]|nr:glucans biosynthesis glucosyltransferase MdoH [Xanthobacteraceae bacterium]